MIYVMSDIHGHVDALEKSLALVNLEKPANKLILLGDYIDGPDARGVLKHVMDLQKAYPDQVVALMGNHEAALLEELDYLRRVPFSLRLYVPWIRDLPLWHVEPGFIFVHAGVDEDAVRDDLDWRTATSDDVFLWKYPADTGALPLAEKIVAGHVSTAEASGMRGYRDIWWDGASHIYVDGDVFASGRVNVLAIELETGRFWQVRDDGSLETLTSPMK